jgi:hypothetical protein
MQFKNLTKMIIGLIFFGQSCVLLATSEEHRHAHVLSPIEEKELFSMSLSQKRRDLTQWNECRGDLRANYVDARCSKDRFISPNLKMLLLNDFQGCVNTALRKSGRRSAKKVHIIHKGIMADGRHSPQSMHSFGRAIDIHSIKVNYSFFKRETISFEELGDRTFYRELRVCWGKIINSKGECGLIDDDPGLTGSIGKEDEDHQRHLHLSIPFCANGLYEMNFFTR